MVATESQKVAKKRPSRAWRSEASRLPCRRKRRVISAPQSRKKTRFRQYTASPISRSPRKVYGWLASSTASPPVLIVSVNQAHVKWRTRARRPSGRGFSRLETEGARLSISVRSDGGGGGTGCMGCSSTLGGGVGMSMLILFPWGGRMDLLEGDDVKGREVSSVSR
ncbi:hypothetical protein VTN02DRAFT_1176 [Thermoascus thermophilus]